MVETNLYQKSQEAINAALTQDWKKALDLNLEISKNDPENTDTLNRLAKAYTMLGQISKAKTFYNKVLKIDKYNIIATKNLSKLSTIKEKDIKVGQSVGNGIIDPDVFLEEPGKTKLISLIDLAMPSVLANLNIGDQVKLEPQRNEVIVFSQDGRRLGKINEDWAPSISQASRVGSKFRTLIKSVQIKADDSKPHLSIFVKETERSEKLSQSIFPIDSSGFTPYIRGDAPGLLSESKETATVEPNEETGDEEIDKVNNSPEESSPTNSLETIAEKEIQDEENLEDN